MTRKIKNHLIWIMRYHRVMIRVIQKNIVQFLTLVLVNFVDVLIIRYQKFCNNMHIIYKTHFTVYIIFDTCYFIIECPDRFIFNRQGSKIRSLRFYKDIIVMVWLRKSGNLRSLILNIEKLYWIWSFYNHARKKNSFRSSYSLK